MRYSLFAGLPLGLVALTAGYEITDRLLPYDIARAFGILAFFAALIALHTWDERRFRRLLNPPARVYPVPVVGARESLILTFEQVQFQDADGYWARWKLSPSDSQSQEIHGKIAIRSRILNSNIVAWLLDYFDQGYRPKTIYMHIQLISDEQRTKVVTTYEMEPMLDWTRCEELIKQSNNWIDESLSRFHFYQAGDPGNLWL